MSNDRRSPRRGTLGALVLALGSVFGSAPLRAQGATPVAHARATNATDATRTTPATRHARRRRGTETMLDGAKTPNAFAPGDSVDVEYEVRGDWIPAQVTDVLNDGYAYAVDLVPHDDGAPINAQIHYSRVRAHHPALPARPASSGTTEAPAATRAEAAPPGPSAIPPAPVLPVPPPVAPARSIGP